MFLDVCGINAFAIGAHAIEVLVNVRDTIFPDPILPIRRRQLVFQRRLSAAPSSSDAIQSRGLTGLLFQRHLRQQVINAFVDGRFGIFVNIHPAVLVQINPALVIDALLCVALLWCRQTSPESVQEHCHNQ